VVDTLEPGGAPLGSLLPDAGDAFASASSCRKLARDGLSVSSDVYVNRRDPVKFVDVLYNILVAFVSVFGNGQ
jgi:hypothetical protein